jgi:hypothetical protein
MSGGYALKYFLAIVGLLLFFGMLNVIFLIPPDIIGGVIRLDIEAIKIQSAILLLFAFQAIPFGLIAILGLVIYLASSKKKQPPEMYVDLERMSDLEIDAAIARKRGEIS